MSETSPTVKQVLAGAVKALGGQERPGQIQMAEAVGRAMSTGEHLLVQAGTGTGKSLGYLVPSLLHDKRVVVATATLALQHQLVERDIPALLEAVGGDHGRLGEKATYAVLKGRSNYACLHRIREGVPDDQGVLVDVPEGSMAAEVLALREWAEGESERGGTGDKDSAPKHTDRVWRQVSVNHRECLGATKCPYAVECFAERAKEKAAQSQLIVTNHSLLAIDAIEGVPMIPEYDAVVIDEAHELSARVTQAATDELSVPEVERAARRSQKHIDGREADELADAADALRDALDDTGAGRLDKLPVVLSDALDLVRDSARALVSAFPKESPGSGQGDADAGRTQARGWVQEIFKTAERMAANLDSDVLWVSDRDPSRGGSRLHVAPLQVWGPLRDKLLHDKTVVFTSATLMIGGDFSSVATSIGLKPSERVDHSIDDAALVGRAEGGAATSAEAVQPEAVKPDPDDALPWRGIDVGSPFDYGKQGILYVAKHLPQPGRDGLGPVQIDEIVDLVDAADGRTLGLFSSRRAADAAAEALRERLPHLTIMAQGEAQLPELARLFVEDPHACLFGTLSLWQGLDVPGDTCQLVLIDRIPFPRPDDPLMSARALAADRAGGNGFMSVSATHAALLLAQGAGRLIRTTDDRGVVAVLDPRLVTARYGGFLRASLPPMWPTTDRKVVLDALKRLSGAASGKEEPAQAG
ncbi:MAG TPA: ATP-dependent DNA helicase [Nocardioidaceae bacterium]|nr:ATP-dependent DNA helicase [Nocardioidaceae bacterium]